METKLSGNLRILVVEDSLLAAKVLEELIKRLPWGGEKQTVFFTNGEEALGYLEKIENKDLLPNLIILDLELPGQHGLEFLKKIKSHSILKSIPVIVNSTSKKSSDIVGSYKEGGIIFLRKGKDDFEGFQSVIHQLKINGDLK